MILHRNGKTGMFKSCIKTRKSWRSCNKKKRHGVRSAKNSSAYSLIVKSLF